MEMRRIGKLTVSAVGLGCNNFGRSLDEQASARVIGTALDAGINLLDTADMYGETRSEEHVGRALRGRRNDAIIATKFGWALDERRKGARPEYVRAAADASLRRLGVDCIDLYQLHVPDPETPIADTLGALDELVRAGKVREIGCSNFTPAMLAEAARAAAPGAARFVSVQNEYSLLHREPEQVDPAAGASVLDRCREQGLALLPFFPLANGFLTGKYRRGRPAPEGARLASGARAEKLLTDARFAQVEALQAWAERRGHTLLELAVSWLLAHPEVASVIAGATAPEQVRANAAAGGWKLGREDLAEIAEL